MAKRKGQRKEQVSKRTHGDRRPTPVNTKSRKRNHDRTGPEPAVRPDCPCGQPSSTSVAVVGDRGRKVGYRCDACLLPSDVVLAI